MDVDRLKAVNSFFGHTAGDEYLRTLAGRLKEVAGGDHVLGRLGGDEFVLVMEHVSSEILGALRDRLVASVEAVGKEIALPLGASVGCATLPEDGLNARDLLDAADRRMYGDKAVRKSAG